jgi:hypothetical protein
MPPTMDKFCDFILITMFHESSTQQKEEDKKAESLIDLPIVVNFESCLIEHRKLIDSLRPKNQINKVFEAILKERMDSLTLDPETMDFYRFELKVSIESNE